MTDQLPNYVTEAIDKATMELIKIPMEPQSMKQVVGLFGSLAADVANGLIKLIREEPYP